MSRTLVLLKPDAYQRNLSCKIMSRIDKKGFKLTNIKFWKCAPTDLIERHYEQDKEKPHFRVNIDFMTSGPIMSIIYEGENVIASIRRLQGNRDTPGTIRGDYVTAYRENLIHASDSAESAEKEIGIWFPEIMD